jgi:hypothetical protein
LLEEGLLFHITEVHSLQSWTGDNLYRLSNHSGAPVSSDSDDFFTHNNGDANSLVRRDSMTTSNKHFSTMHDDTVMNEERWDRRRTFNLKGDILQRI